MSNNLFVMVVNAPDAVGPLGEGALGNVRYVIVIYARLNSLDIRWSILVQAAKVMVLIPFLIRVDHEKL